jgi:hypothetical protein
MFLSVVILGRFTTETHAVGPSRRYRHTATYTTPRDATIKPPATRSAAANNLMMRRLFEKSCLAGMVIIGAAAQSGGFAIA